jgi:nicotine blue oxidoreductase
MGRPKALIRPTPDGPTLVERAVGLLLEGGCHGVTVVVGAATKEVAAVLTPPASTRVAPASTRVAPSSTGQGRDLDPDLDLDRDLDLVECSDWAEGMGASLRTGLSALAERSEVEAVVITLVDLPDLVPEVVRRLLDPQTPFIRSTGPDDPTSASPVESSAAPAAGLPALIEGAAIADRRAGLSRAAYGGVPGHPTLIGRDHWDGVVAVARGDRGARHYFRAHRHTLVECGDLASGRDVDSPADLDA